MKPYFFNPKPDLSQETVHFVVCVHGLDGKYVFLLFSTNTNINTNANASTN